MKRAAGLLLLLFAVWLLTLPGAHVPRGVASPAVSAVDGKARVAVEHVLPQLTLPQVLRAPLWARLPAAPEALSGRRARWVQRAVELAPDRRAAVRRIFTRRRVPRLGAEEPPWP